MNKTSNWLLIVLVFGVMLFLAFNKHSKTQSNTFKSEIWGDKAGYQVYLPATFLYEWDGKAFPDSIFLKTGNGFHIRPDDNKVITKYPSGVAILQSPFFLGAHIYALLSNSQADGYSAPYRASVNVASVFYLLLGLIFLYRTLILRYNKVAVILSLALLLFGTNLYNYTVDESGMSHVYSFSLFVIALFLIQRMNLQKERRSTLYALLGTVLGLLIIVRPTNILFIPTLVFINSRNASSIFARFEILFNKRALISVIGAFTMILPQLIYWNYAHSSFIHYSYGDEGFHFLHPKLLAYWFAPRNGILLYSPIIGLVIISYLLIVQRKSMGNWLALAYFIGVSYIFASWWDYGFGCSFGARNHVDYLALLAFPLTALITTLQKSQYLKWFFGFLVVLCISLTLKLTYSFDGCFYGDTWDWNSYLNLITADT